MNFRLKYILVFTLSLSLQIGYGQSTTPDLRLQSSRLIIGSKANMLDKGNLLISNLDIAYTGLDYGLFKHLSLGGGIAYLPGGFYGQLEIKLGYSFNDLVHTAIVGNYFRPLSKPEFEGEDEFLAPVYALTSLDFNKFSVTFGPGVVFEDSDIYLSGQLAFVFPMKDNLAFISENYWGYDPTQNNYDDNLFLLNLGVRLFRKKWFFDFGISNLVLIGKDGNGILPLPSFSVNYTIN